MSERRDFSDPKYKQWRKRVYARDKFRCQMPGCAGTDKRLNAHHIRCWSSHPALRFVTSNGLTLCRTHHESIRGREEEFESLFSRIANRPKSDLAIHLLMMRYAQEQE